MSDALSRMYPSLATQSAAPATLITAGAADGARSQGVMNPASGVASEAEKELAREQRMYNPELTLKHVNLEWPVDMPAEQQAQMTATVRTELGRNLLLGPDEAKTIVDTVTRYGKTAATAEDQAKWRTESDVWLRKYVTTEGRSTGSTAQLLADAKTYIARSPTMQKVIAANGLENNPQILKIAVEKARALRVKGLLK